MSGDNGGVRNLKRLLDYIIGTYNLDRFISEPQHHLSSNYVDKIIKLYSNKHNENVSYKHMYT